MVTAQTSYNHGSLPLPVQDLMLLFEQGGLGDALVNNMISSAKRNYVSSHHTQKISQMHSSTYKNGWWKTYVYENGKRKEVVRKTEEEMYIALFNFYKNLESPAKTLEDTFNLLIKRKQEQLGRSHNTITDDSRYFYYISEKIRKTPIANVTESDLRTWLVKSYMPTRPKETALRKMLQLLKQIFNYGMSQKLCYDNPAEYILFDDYAKDCDMKKKKDEERAFSEDECKKLRLDALKDVNNPRSLMRMFSMATGMRAGELSALLWTDIQEFFIHVHRQQIRDTSSGHQEFYDVEYTKDERKHPHGGRYVPRTSETDEILELAKQLVGTSDYVFHDKEGNPISKTSYELHLKRSCERLKIETTNNHAFRIAYNSKLIEKGLSAADRALILGHAVQTNEHHYSVSDKRRLDEIRLKLG